MPETPSRKEETHERIVRAAARAIRRLGYNGVGVAEIMSEVGLTHGGFYAHFKNKTALLAEAADRAGAEGVQSLEKAARGKAGKSLWSLVDAYLSDVHLKSPELGCPVVAVGTETARQPPEVRSAATRRIRELVGLIERQMVDWGKPGNHDNALATLSLLVGTMVIARAVDDPALAKSIRRAGREFLRRGLPAAQSESD
ncbi:MAG: TetR/AcrR family transcriptional regulator [Polyangiales bacterium]